MDLPLFARDSTAAARAVEGLVTGVRSGAVDRAQLDAGARRVLALRARLTRSEG